MSHEDKHLSFGPKLGIQLECPVIYPTLINLTKNTPWKLNAGSRNHALYTPRTVIDLGPKLGIQLECPVIYPTLVHLTKNTPCNLHAGSRKSCTVYPWKSAWSSIPALELRSWYPWRRTPLPSWTHGHEIMHSIAQEQCMIFDPCARATSKQGPEHPAQYTPARVHDIRSVR